MLKIYSDKYEQKKINASKSNTFKVWSRKDVFNFLFDQIK